MFFLTRKSYLLCRTTAACYTAYRFVPDPTTAAQVSEIQQKASGGALNPMLCVAHWQARQPGSHLLNHLAISSSGSY